MDNNKNKEAHSEPENQNTRNATSTAQQNTKGESAAKNVHLKDGPWHEKENKNQNPEGKSIEEATDPSKLSQL